MVAVFAALVTMPIALFASAFVSAIWVHPIWHVAIGVAITAFALRVRALQVARFVFAGFFLLPIGACAVVDVQRGRYPEAFDAARWRDTADEEFISNGFTTHQRMARDLADSKALIGKSREDVIALLGEPHGQIAQNALEYEIGSETGFISIDFEILGILLDDRGRVTEVAVYHG